MNGFPAVVLDGELDSSWIADLEEHGFLIELVSEHQGPCVLERAFDLHKDDVRLSALYFRRSNELHPTLLFISYLGGKPVRVLAKAAQEILEARRPKACEGQST